jgi:vanillin dehydrogenase
VELGGKDSLIVLEDADMERATQAANFGSFMHQGQICMSTRRCWCTRRSTSPSWSASSKRAARLKVGDTNDKANVIGPLINDRQAHRVKAQIDDAVAKGAKVDLGGKRPGRFVEPTVLTASPPMDIWHDETFGPVVMVVPSAPTTRPSR